MASQAINSPFIKCVSHSDWKLTVEFKPTKKETSKRFRYMGVPASEYFKMITSPNPGTYYIQNIKGKYKAEKLKPNEA